MGMNSKETQMLKLNTYARGYIDDYDDKIDYQKITEQMREFSGADFVMFNIFDENGRDFTLVGFAGNESYIKKAMDVIGYNIIGKKFDYEEGRNEKFEKSIVTRIESLKELVGSALPDMVTSILEKIFRIDHLSIVRITKEEKTIGNFTLMFQKPQNRNNDEEMLKLFASQVGLFIDKKNSEQKTLETTKRFQSLLKNSVSIITIVDNQGNYVHASESATDLIGIKEEALIGKNFLEVLPDKAEDFMNTIATINKTKKPIYKEEIYYLNDEERIYESIVFPIEFKEGEVVLIGSIANDITERKEKQKEIEYLNLHDHLTGLYNRRFFEEELIRLDVERNLPLSIMMIDVNGLKLINDTLGHAMGDEMLIKSANTIRFSLRADEITARIGGDEFSVILPKCDETQVSAIAERIEENIEKESEDGIPMSLAIGSYTKTDSKENILDVLKKAESIMYKNKIFSDQSNKREIIQAMLSTLHEKHPREEEHSQRVSQLSYDLGKVMKIKGDKLNMLKTAGLLHDIGKIAIDYSIIEKDGKLTKEEYDEVKKHPEIGYRILKTSMEYEDIAKLVLYHHEKIDGTGYPMGIKENEIPLESRIISIVDAYDAMISSRPYKKRTFTKEEAIIELKRCSNTQFDADIVEVFINEVIQA
jgi:diguanylate cyclase (GGDEF)-like protein/PAS domain S-box-containing protein/putative nucleotidyltransferase with HDIG domain